MTLKIVFYHMVGCIHCVEFKPVIEELNEKLENELSPGTYEYKSYGAQDEETIEAGVEMFPALHIMVNDELYVYGGNRDVVSILKYIVSKLERDDLIASSIIESDESVESEDNEMKGGAKRKDDTYDLDNEPSYYDKPFGIELTGGKANAKSKKSSKSNKSKGTVTEMSAFIKTEDLGGTSFLENLML